MKKIIFGCALLLAFSTVFAVEYQGDIQLGFVGLNIQKSEARGYNPLTSEWSDWQKTNSSLYKKYGLSFIEIGNYNMFSLHPIIAVGFMERIHFLQFDLPVFDGELLVDEIGYTAGFRIGPAIGITAPDIVTLNVGIGFGLNITYRELLLEGSYAKEATNPYDTSQIYGSGKNLAIFPGFMLDVQAKFMPNKVVSPLIGFEYLLTPKKLYGFATNPTKTDIMGEVKIHNMKIYLGLTVNFWNKD